MIRGDVFTLPGGRRVAVKDIPDKIIKESRNISKFYNYKQYFLDHEGLWRTTDGWVLIRIVPFWDKRRYYYRPSKKRGIRPIMPAPDARRKPLKSPSRSNRDERAKMGVTEQQSEYLDRWVVTGGKDTDGLTHLQLCKDLGVNEQTARNWLTKNHAVQAEAHRRIGSDITNPVNLRRLWDVLLKSAQGELETQDGHPNPVDAKAALTMMEKMFDFKPPGTEDTAPDLSNLSEPELMDLVVSAVIRVYPNCTQEQFLTIMVDAWEGFFGEWESEDEED